MSHAFSYSVLTVITAWLKVHYPVEFYASNIIHNVGSPEKISDFIEEAKHFGINVKVPDINKSYDSFHILNDHTILFGFDAVMKVGKRVAKGIIAERKSNGAFKGLYDFIKRMIDKGIKSNAVKNLVLAGAFDDFGYRKVMYERVDELFLYAREASKRDIDIDAELAAHNGDQEEYDKLTLMRLERDIIGINITGDPLKYIINNYTGELGREYLIEHLGIINNVKTTKTKKGDLMAFANILTASGNELRVVIFPRVYNKFLRNIERGKMVLFRGKADNGGYIVQSITDAQSIINETNKQTEVLVNSLLDAYINANRFANDLSIRIVKIKMSGERLLILSNTTERNMYANL